MKFSRCNPCNAFNGFDPDSVDNGDRRAVVYKAA